MRLLKKILKVGLAILSVAIVCLYLLFVYFSSPPSDENIREKFAYTPYTPQIKKDSFKRFTYRVLSSQQQEDRPTLLFIHGTIGSCSNFEAYMKDEELVRKFNMIAYDRIGYNYKDIHPVQESIAFERDLLDNLIDKISSKNIILVGYSYGGPIALATRKKVKKIILLAPAVYSAVEPTPWIVNLYKWKATRWLVPKIWQQAAKEKLSHKRDLEKFEYTWKETTNDILCIHGNKDWIVPYSNSEFLKEQLSLQQFELITIPDAGHDLVWSKFSTIKKHLLKQ